MKSGIKLLRKTNWADVSATWKANEGNDPVWQEFAKREKGFDSWEEWRSYQASFIDPEEREWGIYEIENPNSSIPNFRVGPFKSWQNHFEEKNVHTFADLVETVPEWVRSNVGIKNRRANFPEGTRFIGFYFKDEKRGYVASQDEARRRSDDVVVLYEGHHRAAAVALAVSEGDAINFDVKPTIALTIIEGDQSTFLYELLNKNTNKPA